MTFTVHVIGAAAELCAVLLGCDDVRVLATSREPLRVAGEGAAGLQTGTAELHSARLLDAEDATMRQVLAWAMGHDPAIVLRLAAALGWWLMRGRCATRSKTEGHPGHWLTA